MGYYPICILSIDQPFRSKAIQHSQQWSLRDYLPLALPMFLTQHTLLVYKMDPSLSLEHYNNISSIDSSINYC